MNELDLSLLSHYKLKAAIECTGIVLSYGGVVWCSSGQGSLFIAARHRSMNLSLRLGSMRKWRNKNGEIKRWTWARWHLARAQSGNLMELNGELLHVSQRRTNMSTTSHTKLSSSLTVFLKLILNLSILANL
jgi:hypothetical protein